MPLSWHVLKPQVNRTEHIWKSESQLWSYCGAGDPERVPPKNSTREQLLAAGKRTTVRPLLYTFSSYLLRAHTRSDAVAESDYWKTFLAAREAASGHEGNCDPWTTKPTECSETHKRHQRICKNHKRPPMSPDGCATVVHDEWGKPGSPWRPGHVLRHAHRITGKEFLRELWIISGD